MAITGAQVISKARSILSDLTATYRWSDAELVGWLNSGQREIVLYKPNVFAQPVVMQLVPGTVQTIVGLEFIRVNRFFWDFTTPGYAVSDISQELLDTLYPQWHVAPASMVIKNYMFNKRATQEFLVFPPQPNPAGFAEVVLTPYPTDITIVGATITGNIIDDIFEKPLVDYVVSCALSDDTSTNDAVVADKYHQRFISALGGQAQAEAAAKADTDAG
jgi:hypothetical protein